MSTTPLSTAADDLGPTLTSDETELVYAASDETELVYATSDETELVYATSDETELVYATSDETELVYATSDETELVYVTSDETELVYATSDETELVYATSDETELVYATSAFEKVDAGGTDSPLDLAFAKLNAAGGIATRWGQAGTEGNATNLNDPAVLNSDPTLSPDGLNILFYRRTSASTNQLSISHRTSATTMFGGVSAVMPGGMDYSTDQPIGPYLVGTTTTTNAAYLAMKKSGQYVIYRSPVITNDSDSLSLGVPQEVKTNIASPIDIAATSAIPNAAETGMYVAETSASGGYTKIALYTRNDSTQAEWTRSTVAVGVGGTTDDHNDIPRWLSPDQCRLYFASDRTGGIGQYDLYVASKR